MNDLDKLKEIYKILNKALRDINSVSILDEYELDREADKVFNTIVDAQRDLYRLIQERE